ncbi:hypothetical protein [Micromonospora thermarum]|nr:hypothetical protein [Micromonospora thermarum]
MVETTDGGVAAWRLSKKTGGWEPANDLIDEILFAVGGEISMLGREDFVQWVEYDRAHYLRGEGPVFALYETIKAIEDLADSERRDLTAKEVALIEGIRRRTFVMFEEELRQAGDLAADPTLIDIPSS